MPDIKYACSICGVVYAGEIGAVNCERQGQEELPPVGLAYLWYESNTRAHYVGVKSATHRGHGASIQYVTAGPTPNNSRRWPITDLYHTELWEILRGLASLGIEPKLLLSKVPGDCMETSETQRVGSFDELWTQRGRSAVTHAY
jgi:hypothetical protein